MKHQCEAAKLRQQFKKNNTKNYICALVGKVIYAAMTVSLSLLLTFIIEAVEYKSMEKLSMGWYAWGVFLIANFVNSMFRRKYQNAYLRNALTQFKNYVFEKILKQPISNYASGDTGKLISAFSNDLNSIEQHYLIGELNLFVEIISYIITSAYLLFMNWELGLILIVSSLIAIGISFGFGKKVVKHETESSEKASSFVSQTKDLLSGFAVIKSFKAEKEIMGVFSKKNVDLESTKQQRRASNDTVSIVSNISSVVVSFLFMSAGFLLAFNGRVSVGIIIGFYEISGNMLSPIRSLGTLISNRRAANALIDRIGVDLENVNTDTKLKSELRSAPQEIVLDNLSYGYGENNTVLDAPIMRQYDEILILHNGRIEESGTFEELLEQKGYFYSLYHISQ